VSLIFFSSFNFTGCWISGAELALEKLGACLVFLIVKFAWLAVQYAGDVNESPKINPVERLSAREGVTIALNTSFKLRDMAGTFSALRIKNKR